MNYIPETTSPTKASIAAPPQGTGDSVNKMQMKESSTTARPVIVLVSVPERRRDIEKDRQKFATKNALLRHVQSDESVPSIDYVKTIHKGTVSRHLGNVYKDLCMLDCLIFNKPFLFYHRDRRHSNTNADSVGYRSDRRRCDCLPWSDLARGGNGSSHAFQAIRDHSSCRLRRREDQGPRTRERERRTDVRDDERHSAP